jgi:hypothetical protein
VGTFVRVMSSEFVVQVIMSMCVGELGILYMYVVQGREVCL